MRVCCLNNYPLAKMLALGRQGAVPMHHAWGVDALAASGFRVTVAPFRSSGARNPLTRLTNTTRHRAGQLDQETFALARGPFDALYAADGDSLRGIAAAKPLVARRTNLISVVHHLPKHAPLRTRGLQQHAALLTLGAHLKSRIVSDREVSAERVIEMPWGPDLGFRGYEATNDTSSGVVSTGKSNRDTATLARALERAGLHGVIYDAERTLPPSSVPIDVVHPGGPGADPAAPGQYLYSAVLGHLRSAAVVAIPITDADRLTGLTEVNDALALGKPIVISRSPYNPVDVEAVGCGIEVEVGDDDGWVRALTRLANDSTLRDDMGRAGRRFAEQHWNYAAFSDALVEVMSHPSPDDG